MSNPEASEAVRGRVADESGMGAIHLRDKSPNDHQVAARSGRPARCGTRMRGRRHEDRLDPDNPVQPARRRGSDRCGTPGEHWQSAPQPAPHQRPRTAQRSGPQRLAARAARSGLPFGEHLLGPLKVLIRHGVQRPHPGERLRRVLRRHRVATRTPAAVPPWRGSSSAAVPLRSRVPRRRPASDRPADPDEIRDPDQQPGRSCLSARRVTAVCAVPG